ncbi:hypothetical protein H2202_000579 [Exophiala xenobiotica]|uniref:F-box domain-containing protein n=1 Tax=Vermiconidia calcicola TaxID=1690605 RepID=A0AAV9QKI3_9PEZI|nr:hypothetical protein H2202_000579 [Exophiala xenobiotica]KAK5542460.1 hypothetical protein LTR25_002345 [Vermiconidia calcicola]KAK5546318.1 hypothetical protein LTR23_003769 [Chaetothyriales sp. CCFEE 6169]KAK5424903.1 hypothetical protein LTR90_000493 [Exophiala xenobiotica]KAK5434228.1 hypothetical protein LTR34_003740 [Exophiala xenobiotica]
MAQAAPSRKFTTLESLPEHLLREICLYLDSPNLTNFSLVSKFCKGISTSCRKWEIRFQVSTPAKLKQDVEFWMSRLNVFNRARVTKVAIEGQMELSEAARDRRVRHGYSIEEEMLLFPFPEHAEFDAWAPLSNFLSELPSLAKLLYECYPQFPRPLFLSLQKHHPNCQLSVLRFYLANSDPRILHPYEDELLTSPQLCRIETRWEGCEHDLRAACTAGVVLSLPRLNKHLRQVIASSQTWIGCGNCSWSPYRRKLPTIPSWGSLDSISAISQSTYDSISCLRLSSEIDCQFLLPKGAVFRKLKKLVMTEFPLWQLCQHEASWNLDMLEKLTVSICHNSDVPQDVGYFNALLRRLPPLLELDIKISLTTEPNIFNAILAHHHSKLAGLSVIQTAGLRISPLVATDIVQLTRQQSCFGQLADLRIAIPRSRGDRNEALIYHTLGGLPKLQTLQLFLDASPTGSSLDEWESRKFAATSDGWLRNGHVRDVLINMALDETLARSIFHTIASAKGSSSLPLERLRLHPLWAARNGFYHWRTNLCKVTGYVAQPWEVERGERDDQREILFVRRIYAFGGEDHEAFLKSYLNYWEKQQQENTSLSARMEEIFSRAWPNWQQKSDDWRKAWHSYPLATIA